MTIPPVWISIRGAQKAHEGVVASVTWSHSMICSVNI